MIPFPENALHHTMVERFEYVVRQVPDQIAVRSEGVELTYFQLNQAANRLAQAILAARGTESEPIAFILGHNASAIIAILGIMKAGKAYVPIDPFYPPSWITHILDDTQSALVLTNHSHLPLTMTSLATPRAAEVLNVDTLWDPEHPDNLSPEVDNPALPVAPTDMAYILYTSGSSGAPKGAIHTHQDATHNTIAQTNDLSLASNDCFALCVSLGFEVSRFPLYSALLNGALLSLYDIRTNGLGGLPEWLAQEKITILVSTPSTFRHMFTLIPVDAQFPDVRIIVLGGESVTSQDVALFRAHYSQACILVNVLGMTETGLIARFKVDQQSQLSGVSVPAGNPIGDKHIELVDETGLPVESGQIGEIIVKSHYLIPGYWRQPALTAEKFFTDAVDNSLRAFRTGDLGRYRPDGCLEHLGRIDSQIKIRGFRVDLAEVEALIHQAAGVRNVAVTTRELKQSPDQKQLVAYVELESKDALSKKDLRAFLIGKLPDYMVPPVIVFLDALPLTPTGKVNRRSLPEPETVGQGQEGVYVPPRDSIEAQLVHIWERVLKTKPIGVQDDYFELGGTSLLAAQLFAQVEKTFGKKLPLATLFQAATIEGQANILRQTDWKPDWSSLVALRSGGKRLPLFFAAPVGGNVLSYHDLMTRLDPDQPCYGLQALGLDGTQTVHRNVNEIATHYIKEIMNLQPQGPYYLCGSSFGGLVAYEMAQQLHDLGQSVDLVAMFDAYGPGYPRRLPSTSRLRRKIFKYLRRVDTHVSNLRYTDWKGRMFYLQVKIPKLYRRMSRRLRNKIDEIIHPVPHQLKKIHSVHMGAARRKKRYMREPRRFGGRLVLFRAEKQPLGIYYDPKLGWGAVVGDQIEVYEIPGHHTSIIYEPRVHVLADHLDRVLSEIHASKDQPPIPERLV
jgi:amino acid adenylation domain-containing protein